MNLRGSVSIDVAAAPNMSSMRARMPQSAGDLTPAGGGMCLPMVLNSWPMKPSGVQLASPILPPGLHTRMSSQFVERLLYMVLVDGHYRKYLTRLHKSLDEARLNVTQA